MSQTARKVSRGAQHFWKLCEEKGLTQPQVEGELEKWLVDTGRQKLRQNVRRFLYGPALGLGPTFEKPFMEFCRARLLLEIDDNEFDRRDFANDHFGDFAERNELDCMQLHAAVGTYELYRPRNCNGELAKIETDGMIAFTLKIFEQGAGRFDFEFAGDKEADGKWVGHALCRQNFIYLIGVEKHAYEDVISMILTPLDDSGPRGSVLVGTQMMKLSHAVASEHRETVVGRAVALARVEKRRLEENRTIAKTWLLEREKHGNIGYMVDLRQTRKTERVER